MALSLRRASLTAAHVRCRFAPQASPFIFCEAYPVIRHLAATIICFFIIGAAPVLAQTPQRIISLAPNVTELLYDLGLGQQVIAVSGYCDYPPAVRAKPKIGGMSNPSLEAIVALKPDRVVLTEDGNPREIQERLTKLGIPTTVYRAKRLADLPREIVALAKALQVRDRGVQRAARIQRLLEQYAKQPAVSRTRSAIKVLFVVQPEPLMAAGPGTTIDDALQLLGLQNIAAGSKSAYPRYSLEEVLRQAPDMIFIAKAHGDVTVQSQRLLKTLHTLDAVRRGHVYYIGDPLLRLGPRITEGMAEMARHVKNWR